MCIFLVVASSLALAPSDSIPGRILDRATGVLTHRAVEDQLNFSTGQVSSLGEHIEHYQKALSLITPATFFTGVGEGSFTFLEQGGHNPMFFSGTHNAILTAFVENGIFACLQVLFLFWKQFQQVRQLTKVANRAGLRDPERMLLDVAVMFTVVFAVFSLTYELTFGMAVSWILVAICSVLHQQVVARVASAKLSPSFQEKGLGAV